MSERSTLRRLPVLAVALATAAACSQAPQSPLSPSASADLALSDTLSGATLKVEAPIPISPIGGATIDGRKPAFVFANSSGRFVIPDQGTYHIELYNQGGTLIAELQTGSDPSGGSSYQFTNDLDWEQNFSWRVRLEVEDSFGPWSSAASFRTPDEPRSKLPFAVPASCGPRSPHTGNRLACAWDVSAASPEWAGCASGSGVRCHRYTRHLAAALATGDPRWGLITKNPNEQQCTWDSCGRSVRNGLGEDVVAFDHSGSGGGFNWEGWDVVVAAGAPGAHVGWTRLDGRRSGNFWTAVPPFP